MSLISNLAGRFVNDVIASPLNMLLVGLIMYFSYKLLVKDGNKKDAVSSDVKVFKRMPKRDFTLETLKPFDGTQESGRILIAVLGKVFDVSNSSRFYGPGGPYATFAGRDASRALATFSTDQTAFKDTYDDLSDLSQTQIESCKEWEMQFTEKYDVVGKLLKPGETATNYDEEKIND